MYVYMQRLLQLLHQSLQLATYPLSLKVRHHHAVCPFIPRLPLLLIVVCIHTVDTMITTSATSIDLPSNLTPTTTGETLSALTRHYSDTRF